MLLSTSDDSRAGSAPSLAIPDFALIVLFGPTGSDRSAFAQRHFPMSEIISPGKPTAQALQCLTTLLAPEIAALVEARLHSRQSVVLDALHLRADRRRALIALARKHHAPVVAIGFTMTLAQLRDRMASTGQRIANGLLHQQADLMRSAVHTLPQEGFDGRWVLDPEDAAIATVSRHPLACDRRSDCGPFDIIGDIHGCLSEIVLLLQALGYAIEDAVDPTDGRPFTRATPPAGRQLLALGDLTDRGPNSPGVLRLVMDMAARGHALAVSGNHDHKLERALRGRPVRASAPLYGTLDQIAKEPPGFTARVQSFLSNMPDHLVLDDGRLVCAHAGLKEEMHNRSSERVRSFARYGDTDGTTDATGYPTRRDWIASYTGRALVAYGHTVIHTPEFRNNTIGLDTGAVFGGHLTAMRWPERSIVQVPAAATYAPPRQLVTSDHD